MNLTLADDLSLEQCNESTQEVGVKEAIDDAAEVLLNEFIAQRRFSRAFPIITLKVLFRVLVAEDVFESDSEDDNSSTSRNIGTKSQSDSDEK